MLVLTDASSENVEASCSLDSVCINAFVVTAGMCFCGDPES
jgi:hypothetical protein